MVWAVWSFVVPGGSTEILIVGTVQSAEWHARMVEAQVSELALRREVSTPCYALCANPSPAPPPPLVHLVVHCVMCPNPAWKVSHMSSCLIAWIQHVFANFIV